MRIATYLAGAALAVSTLSTIPASADDSLTITADVPGIQAMAAAEMAEVRGATLVTIGAGNSPATDGPVPEGASGLTTATKSTGSDPVIYVDSTSLSIGVDPTVKFDLNVFTQN